jgi:hypothetical protein
MTSHFRKRLHAANKLPSTLLSACLLMTGGAVITAPAAWSQITTASLSGTVTDATGAVIPKATIVLKNTSSADVRNIVSNGAGFSRSPVCPPATMRSAYARRASAS